MRPFFVMEPDEAEGVGGPGLEIQIDQGDAEQTGGEDPTGE